MDTPDIYLPDADYFLSQLAETDPHPDRDHLVQLATAHALTSIALSLRKIAEGGAS